MIIGLKAKDSQIIQQNAILTGGQTINLRARQLVYVVAAFMDRHRPTEEIRISAKDFLDFVNINNKDKWSDIYGLVTYIAKHLETNPILLKKPRSKDFMRISWFSRLGVVQGEIRARFSADIAEYFLYKQGLPYTKILWDLRPYKSNHTARILDLFQRYHIKESGMSELRFEYALEDLKFFFGVHDSYPRLYDFENRVLKAAEKELQENDLAPYYFEYEKIKKGKRVVAIDFTVFVRPEELLRLAPELELIANQKDDRQISLFEKQSDLSEEKIKLINYLIEQGLSEKIALNAIYQFSEPQGRGYCQLIDYGVNRSLAFRIIKQHASFGEIIGYEDYYVTHTLKLLEEARLKRIEEVKSGKGKKRTTPKDKRGGLAKGAFEKQQHFASFMEHLSDIRRKESLKQRRRDASGDSEGIRSLGDLVKNLNPGKE